MEQLWGLWSWMHKQYSCLVQVKASKRLGSDQLGCDNSHEHALKLINTECKHEEDIIHHEHKYRRGYVDFVSTTCVNMCQVKSLKHSEEDTTLSYPITTILITCWHAR